MSEADREADDREAEADEDDREADADADELERTTEAALEAAEAAASLWAAARAAKVEMKRVVNCMVVKDSTTTCRRRRDSRVDEEEGRRGRANFLYEGGCDRVGWWCDRERTIAHARSRVPVATPDSAWRP